MAFTTWEATHGSGVGTGTTASITQRVQKRTPEAQPLACSVCSVVLHGLISRMLQTGFMRTPRPQLSILDSDVRTNLDWTYLLTSGAGHDCHPLGNNDHSPERSSFHSRGLGLILARVKRNCGPHRGGASCAGSRTSLTSPTYEGTFGDF